MSSNDKRASVTTVLAVRPDCMGMAPRVFGPHFISSRIVNGRGYVLVNGAIGPMQFIDDSDDELLVETMTFPTMDEAKAWIDDDAAKRERPS